MIAKSPDETSSFEAQAQLFKLLTHPARLAILEILREGEHCVCHMEAHLGFRQAYLSQHLAVLREAGLVQDRRDGWNIFYRVADRKVYSILDAVHAVVGRAEVPADAGPIHCPCPRCTASGSTADLDQGPKAHRADQRTENA